MEFSILSKTGRARTGKLTTDHGIIHTPAFMPVGTVGSVKSIESRELATLGAQVSLSNAYHLYLRPGLETLQEMGGLHSFMNWQKPILVDSGGFQVLSLSEIRKVTDEGVHFASHLDGSRHLFTPEKVIEIQRVIGADFVMPLDELVGWPTEHEIADSAAERTWQWLQRGVAEFERTQPLYGHEQTLFPILQGSFFPDLRQREAERLISLNAKAYAIGGLAVGEVSTLTAEAIDQSTSLLPDNKPRYAMGIGFPIDIIDAIGRGVDMFDCVVPTRNGRNATLFTFDGPLNMRNSQFKCDNHPVEEGCPCPCCSQYTRAYVHHLYHAKEILALKLGTAHNLSFYFRMMAKARHHIEQGNYHTWAMEMKTKLERPKKKK